MAQYKVTFELQKVPDYQRQGQPVYVAGSFNGWNPKDERYRLQNRGGKTGITIELPKGMFEYKFTGGGWDKVEVSERGTSVGNRQVAIQSDTTIEVTIDNWADHFQEQHRPSTASKNVHILNNSFYIPQLDRHRRVWIYLPEGYAHSKEAYPVLYMQDGQNVFDDATSFSGEWGVDETLDSMGFHGKKCIVVAIDNGGDKRINEYSPLDMPEYGKGEGDAYVEFLARTLKPYIDKHFRTKKAARYTYVAGSSMGGLIAFYAILKCPGVFGCAGVFSPAFWVVPELKNLIKVKAGRVKGRIYFYAGQQESKTMVPDMLAVFEEMNRYSQAKMTTVIRAEGRHTENNWRKEFVGFYKWIMK